MNSRCANCNHEDCQCDRPPVPGATTWRMRRRTEARFLGYLNGLIKASKNDLSVGTPDRGINTAREARRRKRNISTGPDTCFASAALSNSRNRNDMEATAMSATKA